MIHVYPTATGWQYRIHIGTDHATDENGDSYQTLPDRIIGGWAFTEERARKKANAVIDELEL